MSYINLVMSLMDFYPYVGEILENNNGSLYLDKKIGNKTFIVEKVNDENFEIELNNDRDKYLKFYISSIKTNMNEEMFYEEEYAPYVIIGEGGRENNDSIERINLRLFSKNPDKNTTKIFNAIKNKLKKDELIGMGVEGNSALHNNYFYQKKHVGNKIFKTDFHNDKAPLIRVKKV